MIDRVHLVWTGFELTTLVAIGTDCTDNCNVHVGDTGVVNYQDSFHHHISQFEHYILSMKVYLLEKKYTFR